MTHEDAQKKKLWVVRLSIFSNTLLVVFKVAVGIIIGSVSVLSEAIHSGIDLVAALIAYLAVRTSSKAPDEEHRYGHGKFENISGFIEAVLIFLAAGWIIYESAYKLLHPGTIEQIGWGILVMGISAAANMAVSNRLFKVGNACDSVAIKADAWHLRTDVYTSAGVMGGLFLIWLLERVFKGAHFHWLDPVAAIGVACLIIKAAYNLTRESLGDLLDISLPQNEIEQLEILIKEQEGVISFKNLKTRKSGPTKFVEFDLLVDSSISVRRAHALTDTLTGKIEAILPFSRVNIHIEPCDTKCPGDCLPNCSQPPGKRAPRGR